MRRQLAADRFPPGTGPRSWRGRRVSLKCCDPPKGTGRRSKKKTFHSLLLFWQDSEVWRQTLEERDRGWLRGPLSLCEVPGEAPISRRFGLRQEHKIRLIDDFSESSVNSTVASLWVASPSYGGRCLCRNHALVLLLQSRWNRSHAGSQDFWSLQCIQTSRLEWDRRECWLH